MAINSKIEWTTNTWNPITGCTKISEGCRNCYACALAARLKCMGNKRYANGFDLTLHEDVLTEPTTWKKPAMVFVNSMSDIFHEEVPYDFIVKIFDIMTKTRRHTYQLLTKRASRMAQLAKHLPWTENIWMGVTVENSDNIRRIEYLRMVPARVRFISFEPLLSDIHPLDLTDIDWAIVGGESGNGARPMDEEWVINIQKTCEKHKTAFFFKQWGGKRKKESGRILRGRTWDAMPAMQPAY